MNRLMGMILTLICLAGCASNPADHRPAAGSFEGTLSEQVLPASFIGPDWQMQLGLMVDDLDDPPDIAVNRQQWAEQFLKQRRAGGARSYGEIFYYSPQVPPVKVSTLILVYHDADKARRHWNERFGPGIMTAGYQRTNEYGDKSVSHKKYDEQVVLAGNVIIQVSQPVVGSANETVLRAYMEKLGIDRP
jgi:hypothetical protein